MENIKTEGIKYTGSKNKIIPYILEIIRDLNINTILDGFSGTTRVSQALNILGYNVICNDLSEWSETFANCYLINKKPKAYYQPIIDKLNNLEGYEGWFTKNYSKEYGINKAPFQKKNLMKLDAIRKQIENMNLDKIEESVLLTSLILALDKVDSTIGHFVSYLNEWSARSYKDLLLKVPNFHIRDNNENKVLKGDIFEAIKIEKYDLAYFDPPYGSNNEKMPPSRVRYSSYYHFWKTVILNDEPKLFGKANRREDSRDTNNPSIFEEYKKNNSGNFIATEAIKELIKKTNSKYILFSLLIYFICVCSLFRILLLVSCSFSQPIGYD